MTTAAERIMPNRVGTIGSLESDTECDDDDVFLSPETDQIAKSGQSKEKMDQPIFNSGLTPMERLVRVHPIWYLPHIGRVAASSLLRGKENGNFIVRQSTKSNLMALTVKIPGNNGAEEVEHYLIEITVAGVRLEGSPNTFSALPFLLAHYMANGDELECQLHLPSVIKQCQNRRELYSYAILGQEFWTNNMPPSPSWSSSRGCALNSKDLRLHSRSVSSSFMENKRKEIVVNSNYAVNQPVSTANSSTTTSSTSSSMHCSDAAMRPVTRVVPKMVPNEPQSQKALLNNTADNNGMQRRKGSLCSSSPSRLLTFKPEKSDSSLSLTCGSGSAVLLKRAKLRSIGSSFRPAFNLLRREKSDLGWCYSSSNATPTHLASQSVLSKKYSCRVPTTGSRTNSCPRSLNVSNANFQNCVKELKRCQQADSNPPWRRTVKPTPTTAAVQSPPLREKGNNVCKKSANDKRLSAPGCMEVSPENGPMRELVKELKSRQLAVADCSTSKVQLDAISEVQTLDRRSRSLETVIKDAASMCTFAKRLRCTITAKGKEKVVTARSVFHVAAASAAAEATKTSMPCEYAILRNSMAAREGSTKAKEELDDSRSVESVAATVFSEPWDSSMWENLVTIAASMGPTQNDKQPTPKMSAVQRNVPKKKLSLNNRMKTVQESDCPAVILRSWEEKEEEEGSGSGPLTSEGSWAAATCTDSLSSLSSKSSKQLSTMMHERFVDQLNSFSISESDSEELLSIRGRMQRQRSRQADSSKRIQSCVVRLAQNTDTFVGAQVQSFIRCTVEAQETDPHVVIGNVRQFINGLKNYLVKQGEVSLHSLIEAERSNLRPTEFLNIDAILEDVLQKVVLPPLKPHIYQTLVRDSSKNGSLEIFSENMAILRGKSPSELGIAEASLNSAKMDKIRCKLRTMQRHYSPLRKLEFLLDAVYVVYESADGDDGESNFKLPAVDELVRLLVFLLARCSVVGCEIEADYIWGLLHPALLFGEASYYLTALSSAVHILKHIDLMPKLKDSCPFAIEGIETAGAFLRIAIPDEISGAIHYHCFPALPQMSAARLCRMIAHKFGITNPEDHGIYLIVDEFESCLLPSELPEIVKEQLRAAGKPHMFVYKRHEAKIAWPKVSPSPKFR